MSRFHTKVSDTPVALTPTHAWESPKAPTVADNYFSNSSKSMISVEYLDIKMNFDAQDSDCDHLL